MRLYSLRNNKIERYITSRVSHTLTLLLFTLMLGSCASLSHYPGIGRIRRYTITDKRLPQSFDGTTIAFVTDTHYPSKFTRKRLMNAAKALGDLSPDLLLLGGDYVTSPEYADELFAVLGSCKARYGSYAVLGNHDTRIADKLRDAMERNGIKLLAEEADTLHNGDDEIYLCGIKENNATQAPSWVIRQAQGGFTLLLSHFPDYTQNTRLKGVSAAFAGHTHGGQVTLLGLYVPVIRSIYGKRFLSGMGVSDEGVPVITSNGLGTSRKKIRFCAPSEIMFVTLRREGNGK